MNNLGPLFESREKVRRTQDDKRSIDERFLEFHRQHPEVYIKLRSLTRTALASGRKKIGVRMLWERMRWYFHVEHGRDDFKLNDHYHSRYARLLMEKEPDFEGVFETRELKS